MTVTAIMVHGSDGEVMAPIGGGSFIRGKWQDIRVLTFEDPEVPEPVWSALIGLVVPTIFNRDYLQGVLTEGQVAAYGCDVVDCLREAGFSDEAGQLEASAREKDPKSEYTWLTFEPGTYELI